MNSTMRPRLMFWLLVSYGVYALLHGALVVVSPCSDQRCESEIMAHIRQSGACSVFALGFLALLLRRETRHMREIGWSLFLVNAIMAVLVVTAQLSGLALPWGRPLLVGYLAWAAGFAAFSATATDGEPGTVRARPFAKWVTISFAGMTLLETAFWLLVPTFLTVRMVGTLSGILIFTGQMRGAADAGSLASAAADADPPERTPKPGQIRIRNGPWGLHLHLRRFHVADRRPRPI